ncbi:MAG: DsbA family protein [Actinomycetota bacterium]|nr:DsbA family protein [Actinomycetota bacterium]
MIRHAKTAVQAARGRRPARSSAPAIAAMLVVVFAAVVGFGVYQAQQPGEDEVVIPPGATARGVPVGPPNAPVTVDVYVDFQCPACRRYEAIAGDTLDQLAESGTARVVYHPLAYLDRFSSTQYSSRSSAAAGCAAAAGVFPGFAERLFAEQPPEGGDGLPAQRLIELGVAAGADRDEFAACVRDERYGAWTDQLTNTALRQGVTATPTVLVNGQKVELTVAALQQAVKRAA